MDLDARLTFESFVVGPANRLAAAAARRAAESPGRNYNPLFLYSPSGLGKSHILSAIAHHSLRRYPERKVVYQPLETYLGDLTRALASGEALELQPGYVDLRLLLLDDIQFVAGQSQAQEMLLRMLDGITSRGGQVVLASDRPPAEIDRLDDRLLSRFSGGLIVDMGQPDLETRVAILRKKVEERSGQLAPGVAEALARFPFRNVRELQGAMNRVLVVQELEDRLISQDELDSVVGSLPGADGRLKADEADPQVQKAVWRAEVEEVVAEAEAEGFVARRLQRLLEQTDEPEDWRKVVKQYGKDLRRSQEIRKELDELGNPWPEAAATLLRDPDRIEESEGLLASARERARPFARPPSGPLLAELGEYFTPLAVRAADRLLTADRPDYNPLYLHSEVELRARVFLEAVGRTHLERDPDARVGYISVEAFAEEFIRAISDGVAGAWRERWWTVEVLLLHGLQDLSRTERAQEEFFHLFEALKRRDARILLAADRMPSAIEGVDDRLRSRFEGGLVVELEGDPLPPSVSGGEPAAVSSSPSSGEVPEGEGAPDASEEGPEPPAGDGDGPALPGADWSGEPMDDLAALRELAGVGRVGPGSPADGERPGEQDPQTAGGGRSEGEWSLSPERVVLDWPNVSERIVEDL